MVKVYRQSIQFSNITLAIGLWLALLLHSYVILWVLLVLLLFAFLYGLDRAPLVKLADLMLPYFLKPDDLHVNRYDMRVVHGAAGSAVLLALLLLYLQCWAAAWILTGILAIVQTVALFGFFSLARLYEIALFSSGMVRGKRTKRKAKP